MLTPPPDDTPRPAASDVALAGQELTPLTDRSGNGVLEYAIAEHIAVVRRRWHGRREVFALRLPPPDPERQEWLPIYSARMGPPVLEYNPALHRVRVWKDIGGEKRRIPVNLPRRAAAAVATVLLPAELTRPDAEPSS